MQPRKLNQRIISTMKNSTEVIRQIARVRSQSPWFVYLQSCLPSSRHSAVNGSTRLMDDTFHGKRPTMISSGIFLNTATAPVSVMKITCYHAHNCFTNCRFPKCPSFYMWEPSGTAWLLWLAFKSFTNKKFSLGSKFRGGNHPRKLNLLKI